MSQQQQQQQHSELQRADIHTLKTEIKRLKIALWDMNYVNYVRIYVVIQTLGSHIINISQHGGSLS